MVLTRFRYLLAYLLPLLHSMPVTGQITKPSVEQLNNSGAGQLTFISADCSKAGALAEKDIANQIPFLILRSGEAPVVYATDKGFENKFGVIYREEGCVGPNVDCIRLYNVRIFSYLEQKFGRSWRKDIRKDVVGFKEWKKIRKR
ncbi:FEKKY domain-containing protein [Hymenobacter guriensis]|uniref:Uncharacterized protein n=1 Tax=Hymenobacter guriensis TaxID=2793065 RepID=A0ABS0KXS5_9BACT|nr:hypothetical protein [Hymenobacter guriensis]MBG8552668.1 hypothetical protein [Hymenobacter guriensis]